MGTSQCSPIQVVLNSSDFPLTQASKATWEGHLWIRPGEYEASGGTVWELCMCYSYFLKLEFCNLSSILFGGEKTKI